MSLPMSMWAREDLPTNKAEELGISSLSNVELLSIILGSCSREHNAVETARLILNACNNNLDELCRLPMSVLTRFKGVGIQKATRINACFELARRKNGSFEQKPDLGTATRVYNHFSFLEANDVEEFWIALMNHNYKLIKKVRISIGGITETPVDIRIIMRECVTNNATLLTCVHNHPSGNLTPSKCDDALTNQIARASDIMRIKLLDHVIIGNGNYYSYHENGRI